MLSESTGAVPSLRALDQWQLTTRASAAVAGASLKAACPVGCWKKRKEKASTPVSTVRVE